MTEAIIGAAIAGILQGIKYALPQVSGLVTVIVAAILGVLVGIAGYGGLNWLTGLAVAMAAVGAMTAASKVGGSK